MKSALAVVVLLAGMVGGSSPAVAQGGGEPCAEVSIFYSPTVVEPRDFMSYTEDLVNCSTMTEELLVGTRTVGPCGGDQRTIRRETLPAGIGMSTHADFLAPRCLGTYRTAIVVALAGTGQVLDRDTASFRVVEGTP
jgi:hypothetical protein